jgi:hypothetical protein
MRPLACALPLFLASCALARPMVASNADLSDYRAVALARAEGERLARATRYLDRHPDGAWAADVRAAFATEEPAYYQASTKSRSAALDYLAWLPRGPHADAAFALVRSFDEREPEDESSRMVKAAAENEKRLERLAEERALANDAAVEAARVALTPAIYGRPLEQPTELSRWLSSGMNIGRTPTHRTRVLGYTIPSKNGPIVRTLEFTLTATITSDAVASVVIDGPELFMRWAEAALAREVTQGEAERYVRDAVTTLARSPGDALSVTVENNLITVLPK